ncbi:MAG: metalloregulator ArsR/SmtB family transcription factor [Eubacteriales bacterium]|nr:metalloregulator ArsR/SmtB family transcription factor [Eubacteriales bacterium]
MRNEAKKMAETLKMLANEHRLCILCELIDGPKTVGALGEKIDAISQSALSQHLALLKAHGMVQDHKSGQSVTYAIADRRVESLISAMKRNYCDWTA